METKDASSRRFETHVNYTPEAAETPRISQKVINFLGERGELVEEVLKTPIVVAPDQDQSQPLTSYFVSTSHNTYLLGAQLFGHASPSSYTHVITNGAHCVEIDVWPAKDKAAGPIVTHGYKLSKHILFRDVCNAIADARRIAKDDFPLFISLECHVDVDGQAELVQIMKESWGSMLVTAPLPFLQKGIVTPADMRGKIVLMVEYYPKGPLSESASSSSSSDEDESPIEKKKISEELAALGIYARSMKPKKGWLKQDLSRPLHLLINISERSLAKLLRHSSTLSALVANGQQLLRRVYPAGARVASGNLDPLACWRAGTQFAALNWQEFDRGMQLNEAMFDGTGGWVLKPDSLRGGPQREDKVQLTIHIVGLSSLPRKNDEDELSLRVKIHLLHRSGDQEWKSKTVKTNLSSEGIFDAWFDEQCIWKAKIDELAFVRILIAEDKFGPDEHRAVFCARVQNIQQGWRLIRLLDPKGRDSHATLLVNFTISEC